MEEVAGQRKTHRDGKVDGSKAKPPLNYLSECVLIGESHGHREGENRFNKNT